MTTSSTDTNAGPPGGPSPRSRWPWLIVLLAGLTAAGVWQVWPRIQARRLAQSYVFDDALTDQERSALKARLGALDDRLVEDARLVILKADNGISGDRLSRIGDLPGIDAHPPTREQYCRLLLDRSAEFDTRFVAMGLYRFNTPGPVPAEPLKAVSTERPTTELSLHAIGALAGDHSAEPFLRSLIADDTRPDRLRGKALDHWCDDEFLFDSLPEGVTRKGWREYQLARVEATLDVPGHRGAPTARGVSLVNLSQILRPMFQAQLRRLEADPKREDSHNLLGSLICIARFRRHSFRPEMSQLLAIRPVSTIVPELQTMVGIGFNATGLEPALLAIIRTNEPGWTLTAAKNASKLLRGTGATPEQLRAAIRARQPANEAHRPDPEPGYPNEDELDGEREVMALLMATRGSLDPHAAEVLSLLGSVDADTRRQALKLVPFLRRPSEPLLARVRELCGDADEWTRMTAEECLERLKAWRPLNKMLVELKSGHDDTRAARDLILWIKLHDEFEHVSEPLNRIFKLAGHSDSRLSRRLRRDLRHHVCTGFEMAAMENAFPWEQNARELLDAADRLLESRAEVAGESPR